MTKQVTVYTLCEGEHTFTDGLPIAAQFHAKQTIHGTDSNNNEVYIPFHAVMVMIEQNSYETSPVTDSNCGGGQ